MIPNHRFTVRVSDNRVSDIAEAAIGPRSVVATSPDKLEECKWELEADTERFIKTIEVCL
jgi:hypothetical protein